MVAVQDKDSGVTIDPKLLEAWAAEVRAGREVERARARDAAWARLAEVQEGARLRARLKMRDDPS